MRMFNRFNRLVTLVFVFLALVATSASAQTPFGPPDDRYKGYPSSQVAWPNRPLTDAEVAACAALKPYEPKDTRLIKYVNRLKVASVRVQPTDECTYMRVAGGFHLVRRVKGTKVGQDELGRDLIDLGSPTGLVCGNARPVSIPVNVPVVAAPVTPVITVPVPPRDFCPNIEGLQTAVPTGMFLNTSGDCVVPTPPPPRDFCPNIEGVQTAVPTGMFLNTSGDCVVPTPPPPQQPPPPPPSDEPLFSVSVGPLIGPINTKHSYPDPRRGDVNQHMVDFAGLFKARLNHLPESFGLFSGVFGEVSTTFAEKASDIKYQDLQGNWLGKRRDSDDSQGKMFGAKIGYGIPFGRVKAHLSLDYDRFCICEEYNAQNTDTSNERSFKTLGFGFGGAVSTDSDSHKLTVSVDATIGKGHREKETTQHYYGPPVIDFPRVVDEKQDATMKRFGAEGDFQVIGPIHAYVSVHWTNWNSRRPTVHTAEEMTSARLTTAGVRLSW